MVIVGLGPRQSRFTCHLNMLNLCKNRNSVSAQKTMGSNLGLLRHYQPDSLTTRQDLIHFSAIDLIYTRLDLIHCSAKSHPRSA
jgi:hypothetical protein